MSDRGGERKVGRGEPATAVGADPQHTDVGSNFVSNYPPYSFWSEDQVAEVERVLDAPARPGTPLGLYIHVPFCRKRCKFCYFKVFTDKNADDVARYIDALTAESRLLTARPAIGGRPLKFVYVGGGTPSFISSRHLGQLFDALRASFPWEAVEEVTFECEPGTLTRPKLVKIREVGVTRLSLGVENFNDEILEENGRAHLTKEIERVAPWIAELDFDQLNIDLIAGMVGETWETWKETVRRAIEMDAESVTIYQMELPYNTVYSRRVLDGEPIPVADWSLKREWHDYAIRELEAAGYETSSSYTMVKRGRDGRFVYRDSVWRGSDLVGIGLSSFSHIGGVHYQNLARWEPYLERIESGRLAVERGLLTAPEERLVREWILLMKRGHVEPAYFAEKYGVDVLERFAAPLARLEERGMLSVDPDAVRLTRAGLLRADQLLSEFYAERYQNARYT